MACTVTLENELLGRTSTGVLFPLPYDVWADMCERRPMPNYSPISWWIGLEYPIGGEKSTSQATEVIPAVWESCFAPRTELGKNLLMLRKQAVDAGMRLLSEEEVLEEVKRRRGELEDNETDLSPEKDIAAQRSQRNA